MEKEHFIEWIALVNDKDICKVRFLPEQNAECTFKHIKGSNYMHIVINMDFGLVM